MHCHEKLCVRKRIVCLLRGHGICREKPFNADWKSYLAEIDDSQMASTRFPGSCRDFQRKDMVPKKRKVIRPST